MSNKTKVVTAQDINSWICGNWNISISVSINMQSQAKLNIECKKPVGWVSLNHQ